MPGISLWIGIRQIDQLYSWFDHLKESFSEGVQIKTFSLPEEISCLPAKNVIETPDNAICGEVDCISYMYF